MNNVLFYSVSNNLYQKFIPWFVYFLSKSYPESSVCVDLSCCLSEENKRCLELINKSTCFNFTIRENQFSELQTDVPYVIETLRWITHREMFDSYKYMWIGDLDMCICKESPSLINQHIDHMEYLDLPFSNYKRSTTLSRMSGIHIIEVDKWFEAVKKDFSAIKEDLMCRPNAFSVVRNEQVLHDLIAKNICNFSLDCNIKTYYKYVSSVYHGYHINMMNWKGIAGIRGETNSHVYTSEFRKYIKDPIFSKLLLLSPDVGKIVKSIGDQF